MAHAVTSAQPDPRVARFLHPLLLTLAAAPAAHRRRANHPAPHQPNQNRSVNRLTAATPMTPSSETPSAVTHPSLRERRLPLQPNTRSLPAERLLQYGGEFGGQFAVGG